MHCLIGLLRRTRIKRRVSLLNGRDKNWGIHVFPIVWTTSVKNLDSTLRIEMRYVVHLHAHLHPIDLHARS